NFGVVYTISVLKGSAAVPPGSTAVFLLQVQPAGYPGEIALPGTINPEITCYSTGSVASGLGSPNLSPNGDGTISVLVGVNPIIGGCPGMVYTVSLQVSGYNPLIPVTTLTMQLTVQTSATLSMSAVLMSQTAGTATYAVTSYANFSGAVTFGLSGTCATLIGHPAIAVAGTSAQTAATQTSVSVATGGCAAGTSAPLGITGTGTITGSSSTTSATAMTTLRTAPNAAVMTNPPPGTTITGGSTQFSWSTVTGGAYTLSVGLSPGGSDIYSLGGATTASSVSGMALPTSSTVVYAT